MIGPVVTFFKTHKLAIAWISLLGSFAGTIFSAVDLKDTLAKEKKKK